MAKSSEEEAAWREVEDSIGIAWYFVIFHKVLVPGRRRMHVDSLGPMAATSAGHLQQPLAVDRSRKGQLHEEIIEHDVEGSNVVG